MQCSSVGYERGVPCATKDVMKFEEKADNRGYEEQNKNSIML